MVKIGKKKIKKKFTDEEVLIYKMKSYATNLLKRFIDLKKNHRNLLEILHNDNLFFIRNSEIIVDS